MGSGPVGRVYLSVISISARALRFRFGQVGVRRLVAAMGPGVSRKATTSRRTPYGTPSFVRLLGASSGRKPNPTSNAAERNMKIFLLSERRNLCTVPAQPHGSPPNSGSFTSRWENVGGLVEERRQTNGAAEGKASESCVRRFFPRTTAVRCLSSEFLRSDAGAAPTSV